MLTKNTSTLLSFLSLCVLLSCPLTDIYAQAIEEIVVTAQKRGAVNVQDVAESIQAFSSDQLENEFAEGFDDYSRRVPSLSAVNQGSGQTQIVFRGVTAARVTHAQPQDRSTAGLYLDETPVTSNVFNPDVGLFDVNRVEVLRGPQGTLYGASSMSGAIRVITNEPDVDAFEAKGDVTLSNTDGGRFNNSEKFMVNVPVSEGLLLCEPLVIILKNPAMSITLSMVKTISMTKSHLAGAFPHCGWLLNVFPPGLR